VNDDDRVLVDYRTADDAGVYRCDAARALVQTVDFFTPIVDDPYVYGQIAAANSLSDVYAMGGRPLTALAIACFPEELEPAVVKSIFAGGLEKLREARVALLGGHTVKDPEVKFGYSITGEVNPARVWSNAGARPGDALILTKRLGTGIVSTAIKFGRAPAALVDAAVASMVTLNEAAAAALAPFGEHVHACTDITGFGLIGHLSQMAAASDCSLAVDVEAVPLLPDVERFVTGNVPGGSRTNAQHFGSGVQTEREIPSEILNLLYDPQTSGGLVAAVDPEHARGAVAVLTAAGVLAATIGVVIERTAARVILR
jgi:selenide, water dikinase